MRELELIQRVKEMALEGLEIEKPEALLLLEMQDKVELIEKLFEASSDVHRKFNKSRFSFCSIVSGKHGSCSEDCKFCAQSGHYNTGINTHRIKGYRDILEAAREMEREGVNRFSIVTSGKRLSKAELEKVANQYAALSKDTGLQLCASHGTLDRQDFERLKASGVQMYHHNLETGQSYYGQICTTHTYSERIETIKSAKKAGLKVCSGGIFGMGESRSDRIDMLYELKELGVDSIPINVLVPVPGTPMENSEPLKAIEVLKAVAVYRLVLPKAEIRYGGGRDRIGDFQRLGLKIGVDGMITGNYLTTTGSDIERDRKLVESEKMKIF